MTETGAQLFARLESRRCLKDVEPRLFPEDGGPENGDVVEIFGPEGTGKTELLYHLLSRCLLPLTAGGLEVSVVFVDTDYSLDLLRLVNILDQRLQAQTAPPAGPDEALLRSCLSRLLVLHCCSSSQLLLTLHFLETSFAARPDLSLLLVDSISAFYWLDRAEGGASYSKQEEKLNKCSELLGRLLRDYKITVFATCHSIRHNSNSSALSSASATSSSCTPSSSSAPSSSSSSSSSAPSTSLDSDKPYLCRAWQKLVSHRLTCSRSETVPKMAASAPPPPPSSSSLLAEAPERSSSGSSRPTVQSGTSGLMTAAASPELPSRRSVRGAQVAIPAHQSLIPSDLRSLAGLGLGQGWTGHRENREFSRWADAVLGRSGLNNVMHIMCYKQTAAQQPSAGSAPAPPAAPAHSRQKVITAQVVVHVFSRLRLSVVFMCIALGFERKTAPDTHRERPRHRAFT
ncbi:hypothetical protein WMY93_029603 [Mugilogobius chulae]|uniref:RecA family profile 1 domain-containing protein n=1 Tax=Mugilogobius chulae TaxID=88201 RepID=A0AAW0MWB3_9GOBI